MKVSSTRFGAAAVKSACAQDRGVLGSGLGQDLGLSVSFGSVVRFCANSRHNSPGLEIEYKCKLYVHVFTGKGLEFDLGIRVLFDMFLVGTPLAFVFLADTSSGARNKKTAFGLVQPQVTW